MALEVSNRVVRFILTGDSAGALSAQKDVEEGFEGTGGAAEDADEHIGILHKSLEGLKNVIGYGAGILGLAGIGYGIKDIISAGKKWQEQQIALQGALKTTGHTGTNELNKIDKVVEKSATHGGFTPVEEVAGITQLIRAYGSATSAVKLNAAAVDLARGAHLEYAKALGIVAKAQAGTADKAQQYLGIIQPIKTYVDQLTEAQKRLNPELLRHAELLDKEATAQEINRRIMEHYANASKEYSKTASGAWEDFQHVMDLLFEKIGAVVLPILTKIASALAAGANFVIDHWKVVGGVVGGAFKVLFTLVKELLPFLLAYAGALLAVRTAAFLAAAAETAFSVAGSILAAIELVPAITSFADAFAFLNLVMDANPIGAIVTAVGLLVGALVYAYIHVRVFREIVQTAFNAIQTVVLAVVNFIGQHWELLLASITGGLSVPILYIIRHFKSIKDAVESVFNSVASFVTTVWKGIIGTIESAIHKAIELVNTLIKAANFLPNLLGFGKVIPTIPESWKHAAVESTRSYEQGRAARHELALTPAQARAPREESLAGIPTSHLLQVLEHIGTTEVTLNLDGHHFARGIMKNPRGRREIAEGVTLETLMKEARR